MNLLNLLDLCKKLDKVGLYRHTKENSLSNNRKSIEFVKVWVSCANNWYSNEFKNSKWGPLSCKMARVSKALKIGYGLFYIRFWFSNKIGNAS